MHISPDRLLQTWTEMAAIGETPGGGVTRLALTDEDRKARDLLCRWMREDAMQVRVDDLGNIIGARPGRISDLPAVVVGSHLDSVVRGGKYDGSVGVLAGLEVIRTLNDLQLETDRTIEVVNFSNEEGVRFSPPNLASAVLGGWLSDEVALSRTDSNGMTVAHELQRIGYQGARANRPSNPGVYLELHIEQGPVLHRYGASLGAVEGVVGLHQLEVEIRGMASHAGSTPMVFRHDALAAAAEIIYGLRELALRLAEGTVLTVGRHEVQPNSMTVIPERVVFTVDIRNARQTVIERGAEEVMAVIESVSQRHGVQAVCSHLSRLSPTSFDPGIAEATEAACKARGYSCRRLVSGAKHDAVFMATCAPSGMVFVPSIDGHSHSEKEETPWEDIVKGANILLDLVCLYAQQ